MNDELKDALDKMLERMKATPGNPAPYRCKCRDVGWVEGDESGGLVPCERCNARTWRRWKDGCFAFEHRGCEKCKRVSKAGGETFS